MKNFKKFSTNLLSVIILSALGFSACGKDAGYHQLEGMIWNTVYHITFKGNEQLADSILPVLNDVGLSLSVFDRNSLVSRLNVSDSVVADEHLQIVYEASKRINEKSGRRFDPTISPLIDAWGFGLNHTPNSDTLRIDSIMEFIGIEKTGIEGAVIYKNDIRTRFNFSAIAKGYGCDAVGEMFRRNGVKDYMVEIGGEIALSGKSGSGNDWTIGIDAPTEGKNPGEESVMIIALTDCGLATSGNYRNYMIVNGEKRAHTISRETGRPYIGEILSATVVAESCMEADALATACMVGTPAEAMELLKATSTDGMLVAADSIYMTEGFRKWIKNY